MKREAKHTPIPWRATPYGETFSIDAPKADYIGLASINPRGQWDNGIPSKQDRANAEFIVRACNSHDALVEALVLSIRAMRTGDKDWIKIAINEAQEAIVKEKGV